MAAQVLGISGSSIPNSNTDQVVHAVLAHTGLKAEFIKLSDLTIEPCRACLGCVRTNQCVARHARGGAVPRIHGQGRGSPTAK